jgi:hypothetical protein
VLVARAGRVRTDTLAERHDEWAEDRRYLKLDVRARAQALGT